MSPGFPSPMHTWNQRHCVLAAVLGGLEDIGLDGGHGCNGVRHASLNWIGHAGLSTYTVLRHKKGGWWKRPRAGWPKQAVVSFCMRCSVARDWRGEWHTCVGCEDLRENMVAVTKALPACEEQTANSSIGKLAARKEEKMAAKVEGERQRGIRKTPAFARKIPPRPNRLLSASRNLARYRRPSEKPPSLLSLHSPTHSLMPHSPID
jgi:hypothetical protein